MGHQLPAKAKVENHGKLLIVPDVEQEDGGNYVCTANNLLGETMHYFTVTVEGSDCTSQSLQLLCFAAVRKNIGK